MIAGRAQRIQGFIAHSADLLGPNGRQDRMIALLSAQHYEGEAENLTRQICRKLNIGPVSVNEFQANSNLEFQSPDAFAGVVIQNAERLPPSMQEAISTYRCPIAPVTVLTLYFDPGALFQAGFFSKHFRRMIIRTVNLDARSARSQPSVIFHRGLELAAAHCGHAPLACEGKVIDLLRQVAPDGEPCTEITESFVLEFARKSVEAAIGGGSKTIMYDHVWHAYLGSRLASDIPLDALPEEPVRRALSPAPAM